MTAAESMTRFVVDSHEIVCNDVRAVVPFEEEGGQFLHCILTHEGLVVYTTTEGLADGTTDYTLDWEQLRDLMTKDGVI